MTTLWTLLTSALLSQGTLPRECLNPPSAQWADSVLEFSSEYGNPNYGAEQVLGPCDTFSYGDAGTAWAAKEPNLASGEFITVGFKNPVHATGAVIRETYGSGFVTRVELIDADNGYFIVWEGEDLSPPGEIHDLELTWNRTADLVKGLRLTIAPDHSDSWEEVDSIQLIGEKP